MKNRKNIFSSIGTRSFRVGGYSVAAVVIVLTIAVALNAFAAALPSKYTKLDTTASGLYTLSDQTEKQLAVLDGEVEIYWIVQSGREDSTLASLLDRYSGMSRYVKVIKKDPDVYPGFAQQYTNGRIYNNSLVVCRGDRYRYIDYNELYEYDYSDYYTTGSYGQSFAAEGAITGAIGFVTNDELPVMYTLEGHGEAELSTAFRSSVEKQNIELKELSLLTAGDVPSDADVLLIAIPQSDISSGEADKIAAYLKKGGRMLLVTDPPKDGAFTNLGALMSSYGVSANDGIVVEADQNNYAWGTPYYLLPDIGSHSITAPLADGGYHVLLSVAQGLSVSDTLPEGVSATQLLTTSSSAYSKTAGYGITTYEKEDGDIDGPFALGVAITASNSGMDDTRIVWISSGALLDDESSAMVSGGNQDLFLNALSWMYEQEESISIHSKNLSYEYLTMSSSAASAMTAVTVWLLPALFLGIGVCVHLRRKHT